MITKDDIIGLYEKFYSKRYGNSSYKFIPTDRADKSISKFLDKAHKRYKLETIGIKFLTRYFTFQFDRLNETIKIKRYAGKSEMGGKIQIYDIIGDRPLKLFINRNRSFDYKLERKSSFSGTLVVDHNLTSTSTSEELEKKRFLNTDRGLINCLEKTTLFYHKSVNCMLCTHKNDCKKLLKTNYINIYNYRGYGSRTN